MAKLVKSIRFDEELVKLFSDYASLLGEIFGYSLSFSALVNEAFAEYMKNSTENWVQAMAARAIVDRLPNGRLKRYDFSEDQIKQMESLKNDALSIWASTQQ